MATRDRRRRQQIKKKKKKLFFPHFASACLQQVLLAWFPRKNGEQKHDIASYIFSILNVRRDDDDTARATQPTTYSYARYSIPPRGMSGVFWGRTRHVQFPPKKNGKRPKQPPYPANVVMPFKSRLRRQSDPTFFRARDHESRLGLEGE